MSKTFNKFTIPKSLPRNPGSLAAKQRKAGAMKDSRSPRGGSRNLQSEFLEDYNDNWGEWEDVG